MVVDTSLEAYESMKDYFPAQDKVIVDYLVKRSPEPLTAEQISECIPLDKVQVGRRLAFLRRQELIFRTVIVHKNKSGRRARAYIGIPPGMHLTGQDDGD